MLGKNHAKLASVKANIAAVRPYFVNPRTNALDLLKARNTAAWTNDAHFLTDCALPTNAISETPWFKSQYASTTGGWVHCWLMLTNMVWSESGCEYNLPAGSTNFSTWWGESAGADTNYSDSISAATADWKYEEIDLGMHHPYRFGFTQQFSPDVYYAALLNSYWFMGYDLGAAGAERQTTFFHKTGIPELAGEYDISTNSEFNAQGASVTNGWVEAGVITTNSAAVKGVAIGIDGSISANPGVPSAKAPILELYSTVYGWETIDERAIHNWTYTTNGFKFR